MASSSRAQARIPLTLKSLICYKPQAGSVRSPWLSSSPSSVFAFDDENPLMTIEDLSNTYPLRSRHVTWKVLDGEGIILDLETGVYFTLNASGTTCWERLDGKTSLAVIASDLLEQFDVPLEQAQRDLIELTQTLMDEGLVRITDGTSTTASA